jgi:hypothetical protein
LAGNTTTLGRIGSGFMYADWKSQVAYTSPNFNGFQFTAGVTQAWNATSSTYDAGLVLGDVNASGTSTARGGNEPAFEAKASYAFTADQVNGKVWVSGISQKVEIASENGSATATSGDVGMNVNAAGFGLTGYYYYGKGIGQTLQFRDGFDLAGNKRKSEGGYVQGTYTLPGVGTKLGVSWGQSRLSTTEFDQYYTDVGSIKDEMWTGGVYHPITKHLNLVAEYSESKRTISGTEDESGSGKAKTVSLGAILFF